MRTDEIICALRTLRCADPCNCLSCPCDQFRSYDTGNACDDGTRLAAADLLKSQKARITELETKLVEKTNEANGMRSNWYKCSENYQQKCRDIEELETKIAESQRREQAAEEDIHTAYSDGLCEVCGRRDTCTMMLDRGEEGTVCHGIKFEWRGPQKAGEGETE